MTQNIENRGTNHMGQPRQQQPEKPTNEEEQEQEDNEDEDDKLDEAIEMTFPASDPISI
jgi:hypothetical protein